MARTCAGSRKDDSMSEEQYGGDVSDLLSEYDGLEDNAKRDWFELTIRTDKELRAELAAMQEQNKKMIELLKKARNDEFCDNDGGGCGTGSRADDLLEEMGIE